MRGFTRAPSLVAAVVGAIAIALTQPPASFATTAVAKNNTLSVSSGKVIVFASGAQTFTNTGIAYSGIIGNGTVRTFHINNSGNFSASRFTLTITLPNNSNVSAFRRCAVNVSFIGTNTCASGSSTNVTHPVTGVATVYTLTLPANGFYSFQIVQNKVGSLVVSTVASLTDVTGAVSHS
jgi:hypothetical protein